MEFYYIKFVIILIQSIKICKWKIRSKYLKLNTIRLNNNVLCYFFRYFHVTHDWTDGMHMTHDWTEAKLMTHDWTEAKLMTHDWTEAKLMTHDWIEAKLMIHDLTETKLMTLYTRTKMYYHSKSMKLFVKDNSIK